MNIITFKDLENVRSDDLYNIFKTRKIVIDAENAILGRLVSIIVKLLRLGFEIHVVNVEKAVVTGDRSMVINSYKALLKVKTHKNPYRHSVHRPRNPINIFKKAVKNMLPKDNWLKIQLMKKVKAHIGIPLEFKDKQIVKILECDASFLKRKKAVTIAEIAKELGWKGAIAR